MATESNGKLTDDCIELSDLTPTERRMFDKLKLGTDVAVKELQKCLYVDDGPASNIHPHLSWLRAKVARIGLQIVCVKRGYNHSYRMYRPAPIFPIPSA